MVFKRIFKQSNLIIYIFITLAVLMISSALMELRRSRKDLYSLMEVQSHTLLESIMIAAQNSLLSNEYLEEISRKRLLNNANLIKRLYEEGRISNEMLEEISAQNDIFRINIFDNTGHKIYTSFPEGPHGVNKQDLSMEQLAPIFSGQEDTLIIGLKKARSSSGNRYAVAIAAKDRHAIVLNIDAERYLAFIRNIGFGSLIGKVANENSQIEYIALQDNDAILAATGNIKSLESISSSDFLTGSYLDSIFRSRIIDFDSSRIFEIAHPFTYDGETIGLIRIGLSTQPLRDINKRIFRRLIITTIGLIMVGMFVLSFLFIRQRLGYLRKRYQMVETYSGNIIDNVSDGIIVFQKNGFIRIFNHAAEQLFNRHKEDAIQVTMEDLFAGEECLNILKSKEPIHPASCTINNQKKYILVSRSNFHDADGLEYVILVIKDLTEQKLMEQQMERKQRLSAMGELASGVAHEIRNPLNAIATIIQQLIKDFKPEKDQDEYRELTGIVYGEVGRINDTIQDFLRFARPEPIHATSFNIEELFKNLEKQYQGILKEQHIDLRLSYEWKGTVVWDKKQIKQVLINILQNAIEALHDKGWIAIDVQEINNSELEIKISDNGPGMDQKTKENIFNLYFTTKARGTGIGLSLVQRIIYEHGGMISVDSDPGKGTTFTIRLSKEYRT